MDPSGPSNVQGSKSEDPGTSSHVPIIETTMSLAGHAIVADKSRVHINGVKIKPN